MLYNPIAVSLLGIFIWLAVRILSPVYAVYPLNFNTVFFITSAYASFFIGCFISMKNLSLRQVVSPVHADYSKNSVPTFDLWFSAGIACLSMALRIIDRITRGVNYFADSDVIRGDLANSKATIYSIIGSPLMPLCYFPLLLILSRGYRNFSKFTIISSFIISLFPPIENSAQLSRSVILITILLIITAVCLSNFSGKLLNRKFMFFSISAIITLILISTAIFIIRISQNSSDDISGSVRNSVYVETIRPTNEALLNMSSSDIFTSELYSTIIPNALYYTHGVYEFNLAFNRPDDQKFTYGAYQIFPIAKIMGLIYGDRNVSALDDADGDIKYRSGVYTTILGPMWIDFGYFTFIILLIIGYIINNFSYNLKCGKKEYLPIYSICLIAIIMAPVLSFIESSFGFYCILIYSLTPYFYNMQKWRHAIPNG